MKIGIDIGGSHIAVGLVEKNNIKLNIPFNKLLYFLIISFIASKAVGS